MTLRPLTKILIYILIAVLICSVFWLIASEPGQGLQSIVFGGNKLQASLINGNQTAPDPLTLVPQGLKPVRDWTIADFKINARAASCVEVSKNGNDKILFQENDEARLPIASLSKLMAAVVVLENYNLKDVATISRAAVDQVGVQGLLSENERFSVDDLLHIALIESSNDAIYSLAELMGVEKFVVLMNLKAKELELLNSNFKDPSGLDATNYSTVQDLVKLTKYLLYNYPAIWAILSQTDYRVFTAEGRFHHIATNTNELLGQIPDIVGGKTGKTLEAKGCLLLITKSYRDGNDLIYILLGSSDRFSEMRGLINWVNTAYKN